MFHHVLRVLVTHPQGNKENAYGVHPCKPLNKKTDTTGGATSGLLSHRKASIAITYASWTQQFEKQTTQS
jgi:hypothetical protein